MCLHKLQLCNLFLMNYMCITFHTSGGVSDIRGHRQIPVQVQESDSESSECSSSGSDSSSDDSSPSPPVKRNIQVPSSDDSESNQSNSDKEDEEIVRVKGRGRGRGRGKVTSRLGVKRGGRAPKGRVEKLKPVRSSRLVKLLSMVLQWNISN